MATKSKNKQRDYIKLKSFYTVKAIINIVEYPSTEWENIFANNIPDK